MKPLLSATARRKSLGGVVAIIGFMLSPLSWWNDLVVNVPLALGFAWFVSLIDRRAFAGSFVLGYWLTNIIGLILLDRGTMTIFSSKPRPFDRKQMVVNLAISILYTGLIILLVRLKILAPLPDYFLKR